MPGGTIIKLARAAAEEYVKSQGYLLAPAHVPPSLRLQQACYVAIFENPGHRPRASFGHPLPKRGTLCEEVIMNTIEAITQSTHHPLRQIDLPHLVYRVTVLGPLERISRPEHLNPEKYGLYLRSDKGRVSIILPHRVGIETAQDQIATAFREANIDARSEATTLYRFPTAAS